MTGQLATGERGPLYTQGDRVAIYMWHVKREAKNLPVNRAQAMWSGGGSVVSRNKPGLVGARALRHPLNCSD